MDHPFLTRRNDLERATKGLQLAGDLRIFGTMTHADHAHVLARRDPKVSCDLVRDALERHAGRLGMLLEDLDALCAGALAHRHAKTWSSFVESATPPSDAFWRDVEAAAVTLRTLRDEVSPMERDDASSSYSDYSDSDTESTESSGGSGSGSGSEEESEEEKEVPKKKPSFPMPKGLTGKRKPRK